MTSARLVRVCTHCGLPTNHTLRRPSDLDPEAWDRWVADACTQAESMERLELAVNFGVNIHEMLVCQQARFGRRES